MVRRAVLFVILVFSFAAGSLAREICDTGGGGCANHLPHPGPDFGTDPQGIHPPQGGGGGGGPVFIPSSQEPIRSPDKGPLGVVLSTGEFQITVTDLEIPGRGFPFRLQRTYRSKGDGEMSLLGYNWTLSLDEYLTPGKWWDPEPGHPSTQCDAVQWQMGNGFSDVWVNTCNPLHVQKWKAFLGFFGQIRFLSTTDGYQIRYPDGTVKTYGQLGRNAQDQDIWILTKVEDRNGNVMTIHHDSSKRGIDWVADTLGRKIIFEYENHRLKTVTDFNIPSRSVVYTYDQARGDLITVRSPIVTQKAGIDLEFSSGKTTVYYYLGVDGCVEPALMHNIKSITDGNHNTFLTNTYRATADTRCGTVETPDPNPIDVMDSQIYGDGTPLPRLTYDYAFVAWGTAANVVANRTTVTDRAGNQQVHSFNGQGNPLSIEYKMDRDGGVRPGEGDYVEHFVYVDYGGGNQPMLVAEHTQSGGTNVGSSGDFAPYLTGMTETMIYDQSGGPFKGGNLLSVHRTPGERGAAAGQGDLWTRYTYDPIFNQPLTIEDPSLHVTNFTYDWQEGNYDQLIDDTPPANKLPAHLNSAWWPAGYLQTVMDPVWGYSQKQELNGDGYHRGGNLIKVSEGVATDYAGLPTGEIITYTAYNSFGLPTRTWDAEDNETQFRYFSEDNPDGKLPVTPPPPPEDGRDLSSATDEAGGGYLKEKLLDATLSVPSLLPVGVSSSLREGGQNPSAQNILLSFEYDPVGNIAKATDGRGVSTVYTVNELNQIVQITHAATGSNEVPSAPAFSYLEQFRYDANNNVVQYRTERRENGGWITQDTAYDILDRKTSETISTNDVPAISLTTSYGYDKNGNLEKTVFPAGNAILRIYDERDLLYREVVLKDPSPNLDNMAFDPAVDSVTTYDYDGSGNVIQVTDPEGHKARSRYDGYNRKVVGFDPAFQKSTYRYDIGGNLLEQISFGTIGGPTPEPPEPPISDYPEVSHQILYYDELSRLRRTDTRFFKPDNGTGVNLNTDCNAGLGSEHTNTCPAGPGAADSPAPAPGDGWVTNLVGYDRLGRVVRSVDDNGHASETRYDGLGRKIKVLMNVASPFLPDGGDPLNNRNTIDYTYDPNGNVKTVIETEYGADGTVSPPRLLLPQRYSSEFKYDSMNRQIESKLVGRLGVPAINLTTTMVYDSRGNCIQVTDPAGGRTKSYYDGLNRLTKTEAGYFWNGATESVPANMINTANPDGKITTTYGYDSNSRLAWLADDNNRGTTFDYDSLNRQTRITYPDGSYRAVTFNLDSLATSWTHSNNMGLALSATTQFDWLHRAKQIDVDNSAAPGVLGTHQQSFEYDGLGRITSAKEDLDTNNGSQVVLTYNSMGKVLSERQIWRDNSTGTSLTGDRTVDSVYDGVGFRTSVVYPGDLTIGPVDRTVTYVPDELSRTKQLTDSATGGIFQYDYLGPSRVLSRIYTKNDPLHADPDPITTVLTMFSGTTDPVGEGYDNARRLVKFAHKLGGLSGADLPRFDYGYDNAGNRLFERRLHECPDGLPEVNGVCSGGTLIRKGETYGYDAVYRLINRKEGNLNTSGGMLTPTTTQDFTLDGLGNWKTHKKNSSTYNQIINSLNQYEVFNGTYGQRTLAYDFLGNLSNETRPLGMTQFSYDFLNRLVLWVDEISGMRSYRYDALGRRISKNVGGSLVTHFFYDGDRLIQERDGEDKVVASYVYGASSEEVLTRRRWQGGTPSNIFYHTNALGSVMAVTSDTGTVLERYKYDAYGQVTFLNASFSPISSSNPGILNNILFTGRYYDTETKLYYYRARTYHPYMGRFLQRDPLGEEASINLYNYVFNNPVNMLDPTGMHAWTQDELSEQFASDFQDSRARMHGGSTGHSDAWHQEQMDAIGLQGLDLGDMRHEVWKKQQKSSQGNTDAGKVAATTGAGDAGMLAAIAGTGDAGMPITAMASEAGGSNPDMRSEPPPSPCLPGDLTCSLSIEFVRVVGRLMTDEAFRNGIDKSFRDIEPYLFGGLEEEAIPLVMLERSLAVESARARLLRQAQDPRLRDAIRQLFRESAIVGNGSSMDALRFEDRTGFRLSPKTHAEKVIGRREQLKTLLRDGNLNPTDRAIVKELLHDIQNTLGRR